MADVGAVEGDWLIALAQDSGKGRQGRPWQSLEGNFFGSTLVTIRAGDPAPQSLSLAAGLAVIRAVEAVAPATGLILKWPNDLLMGQGKLAGILLERSGDRLVAGFGVNLAVAPDLPDREAATLASVALVSPQSFAPVLAGAFARALEMWRTDSVRLTTAWMESAHAIGTSLRFHDDSGAVTEGKFAGLEADGALRLELADGSERTVRAGDISLE
ncbi:biotin--[acetyl-CoA-carboxylase] ligase [Sphingomonas piscis]|uniref:biotin--[acetyl-CoA-carboxylase] ligase n=1 Tax=Sphingomonas piscis TaxID=2714943 RepID=UPI001FEC9712|nr:biotin--[acetyl-CoA-carboxylase] ligase [Sphingomonas piscis]